jgi:2-polyprenyl-6-methoxyphenol hydroxylase-like FAD-dependent oxidoreductase
MNITIIGAGIGGLSAAIAIRKNLPAATIEIFEASSELKAVGAGLGLAANAVLAFDQLGIKDKVLAQSKVIERLKILDKKGRTLTETDNMALNRAFDTVSNFTVHRAALQEVLLSELKNVRIHYGKKVRSFTQHNGSVELEFTDGSIHTATYVIAADGIHSVFRKQLLPGSAIRFAGYTCWRGVTSEIPASHQQHIATETWAEGKRFGIVTLKDNRIYWFACINAPGMKVLRFADYTREDLLQSFSGFHAPVCELIRSTPEEDIIWNDIIDFKPVSRFAFGNILLLGDAAHATTPNMGQGACQAIEDAAVLGNLLRRHHDIGEAFRVFEQKRLKRTAFIVNRSWQIGKMAQLGNPLLSAIRNALMKLVPASAGLRQIRQVLDVHFD